MDSQKEIVRFYGKRVKSGLGSKREISPVQKRWVWLLAISYK